MRAPSHSTARCVLAFCVATGSLLSLGCGSPSLGELETSAVSITLTAKASAPAVAALGAPAGGLGVSRAFVSASSLTLLPCSDAAELVLPPRGYDLLASPAPNEYVTTAVTELCGLRLDVDPLAQNAADGIPEGASMYVEGTDAAGTPFALTSEQSLSFMLEAPADSSFGDLPLFIAFDLSTWLQAIVLTEDMADEAVELLESQARASVAVYTDTDRSGSLDDAEQTPVAKVATER